MRNSRTKGFTLIELIVVIAIIGVLAAILVPAMMGYLRNSRVSRANGNAKIVFNAVAGELAMAASAGIPASDLPYTQDLNSDNAQNTGLANIAWGTRFTADFQAALGENYRGMSSTTINREAFAPYSTGWIEGGAFRAGVPAALNGTHVTLQQLRAHARTNDVNGAFPIG